MPFGHDLNRLAGRLLAAAIALLALIPAAATAAAPESKGEGPLTPVLAELADPALADRPPAVQADRLGLPVRGPGSLVHRGERVLVTARFAGGAVAAFEQLRQAGGRIVSAGRSTQTVTLAAAPEDLPAVAAVPGVRTVWQVREPIAYAAEAQCEGGAVISEGLAQLRVDEAREAFELRGKGITIGVLSDSFDTAEEAAGEAPATDAQDDEASGDLPGPAGSCAGQQLPVDVLDEGPAGESDEGRAMLQIIHDLAPHASLAFATAFESEESFAQNIERLARPVSEGGAGADVIVDDVAWFEEPFFQDGPIAVAIDKVTAEGVTYLSATGNDNIFDSGGNQIASWEAPAFRDSAGCPAAIVGLGAEFNGTHCMDFNPTAATDRTFGITVAAGQTLRINLQWAEPWNGVGTDLDAFLLSGGGQFLAWSVDENSAGDGTQRPVEIVQWTNESASAATVHLAINRYAGTSPRLKFILMQNGGGVTATEYPKSSGGDVVGPTIFGHAGAAAAISVAAVPFDNSAKIETYSSRGPVAHYFGPVTGTAPAAPLGLPEVVAKPDLAATDCGATTFFAFLSSGTWRFCGTSAAAPHAAAVAALVRQAEPTLTEPQVRGTLTNLATPVGAFTPEAAGAGLVDAFEAIGSLPGPIVGGDGPGGSVPPVEPPPSEEPPTEPEEPPVDPEDPPTPETPSTEAPPASGDEPRATRPSQGTRQPPSAPVPDTRILQRPPKLVRARVAGPRLVFRFGSDQPNVTYACKVDRAPFRACSSRLTRRFAPGRHLLKVKARTTAGQVDPTPAVVRFRVAAAG
jgi:hypothetical protein